jgi:hypothetical protein
MSGRIPCSAPSAHVRAARRDLVAALLVSLLLTVVGVGTAAGGTVTRDKDAERYALSLLNCTRTGGWVTKTGACRGRASGTYSAYRKPLRLHQRIGTEVAWPWARTMASYAACSHSISGQPDLQQRFATAGFRYWYYGENIGCGWGHSSARAAVLSAHRAMQAEKRARGPHWLNIKQWRYKSVGIGVAVGGPWVMVVYDFYGKRY